MSYNSFIFILITKTDTEMKTSIFYIFSVLLIITAFVTKSKDLSTVSMILGMNGILLLGIGIGGTITNHIWKKYDEARKVIQSLLNK
jgi:VIT1/CCC1 family predicted Fe2+/Mn2+ transporter